MEAAVNNLTDQIALLGNRIVKIGNYPQLHHIVEHSISVAFSHLLGKLTRSALHMGGTKQTYVGIYPYT